MQAKALGRDFDPGEAFLQLTDADEDLLVHSMGQHASMDPAADSLTFAEPQVDVRQQQQQEDHGSWAALGAPEGGEERPQSSALADPPDPRLGSDNPQQEEDSEQDRAYSAEPGDAGEQEDGEGEDVEDRGGWQSTSKICCQCDNGGKSICAAAAVALHLTSALVRAGEHAEDIAQKLISKTHVMCVSAQLSLHIPSL